MQAIKHADEDVCIAECSSLDGWLVVVVSIGSISLIARRFGGAKLGVCVFLYSVITDERKHLKRIVTEKQFPCLVGQVE